MRVTSDHMLDEATVEPSTHWDERPLWARPELIVVHCVSLPEGQFATGYPQQLFTGVLDVESDPSFHDLAQMRVAPHLFIDRRGRVEQFVSFDKRAWHAGVSGWRQRPRCNDFAIGIELEGCINSTYEAPQYDALVQVCVALLDAYPGLAVDAIVGHNEIAPGRKFDPGPGFDWRTFLQRMYAAMQGHAEAHEPPLDACD